MKKNKNALVLLTVILLGSTSSLCVEVNAAERQRTIIQYDPALNSEISPDGTVFDRLTGQIIKKSANPMPNYGYPIRDSRSSGCYATSVKQVSGDGQYLTLENGEIVHINDNAVDVGMWQFGDELRICDDEIINVDDNTSASFDLN